MTVRAMFISQILLFLHHHTFVYNVMYYFTSLKMKMRYKHIISYSKPPLGSTLQSRNEITGFGILNGLNAKPYSPNRYERA